MNVPDAIPAGVLEGDLVAGVGRPTHRIELGQGFRAGEVGVWRDTRRSGQLGPTVPVAGHIPQDAKALGVAHLVQDDAIQDAGGNHGSWSDRPLCVSPPSCPPSPPSLLPSPPYSHPSNTVLQNYQATGCW